MNLNYRKLALRGAADALRAMDPATRKAAARAILAGCDAIDTAECEAVDAIFDRTPDPIEQALLAWLGDRCSTDSPGCAKCDDWHNFDTRVADTGRGYFIDPETGVPLSPYDRCAAHLAPQGD